MPFPSPRTRLLQGSLRGSPLADCVFPQLGVNPALPMADILTSSILGQQRLLPAPGSADEPAEEPSLGVTWKCAHLVSGWVGGSPGLLESKRRTFCWASCTGALPQPLDWPSRRWGRRRFCCFRPVSGAAVEHLGGILVSSALGSCILGFLLHFSSKQSPKGAHHAQQRNGPGAPEAGSLLPVVALFSIYPQKTLVFTCLIPQQ